jgi:transposase
LTLARLHRAGELTAVWVPDGAQEALRDLTRAREDIKRLQLVARLIHTFIPSQIGQADNADEGLRLLAFVDQTETMNKRPVSSLSTALIPAMCSFKVTGI